MKKIIKFFLLTFILTFCLTTSAYAEKCKVVSGTGKEIGDEVACGTENFYVISNDGNEIKMMAKYNLYVGANWNKVILDNTYRDGYYNNYNYYYDGEKVSGYNEWISLINNKLDLVSSDIAQLAGGFDCLGPTCVGKYGYFYDYNYNDSNKFKLYIYENISEKVDGYGLQNEKALGVTGKQGNANYPIYATTIFFNDVFVYSDISNFVSSFKNLNNDIININLNSHEEVDDFFDSNSEGYVNVELSDGNEISGYLDTYDDELKKLGYNIKSVDILNISELNDLVKNITNKELPLSEWYSNADNDNYTDEYGYTLGDLKEYLSNDYSWIWNTSYYLKTISLSYNSYKNYQVDDFFAYFVSSQGEICYDESFCYSSIPRAGIRPVVTIAADQVYNVYTKDDGNGTVTYEREDGVVHFTVTPKDGYVLGEVKVTDANGNTVTFTDYTFTMPSSDVTIEAIFKKIDNPITSTGKYIICLIGIVILLAGLVVSFKFKYNKILK